MKTTIEPNKHVAKWLNERKGSRVPVRSMGDFENFANSRTSCCWGQPLGGMKIDGTNLLIAVCQPSIQRQGQVPVMFYDYREAKP